MLNVEMEKNGDELLITLEGRLNSASSKGLGKQIEAALDGVNRVVLEVSNLEYISSAGLRIIIAIQQRMESIGGEDVIVRNATPMVLDTLEMTGFGGIINVE